MICSKTGFIISLIFILNFLVLNAKSFGKIQHKHIQANKTSLICIRHFESFLNGTNAINQHHSNTMTPTLFASVSIAENFGDGTKLRCLGVFVSDRDIIVDSLCLQTMFGKIHFNAKSSETFGSYERNLQQKTNSDMHHFNITSIIPRDQTEINDSSKVLTGVMDISGSYTKGQNQIPLISLPDVVPFGFPCVFPILEQHNYVEKFKLDGIACWQTSPEQMNATHNLTLNAKPKKLQMISRTHSRAAVVCRHFGSEENETSIEGRINFNQFDRHSFQFNFINSANNYQTCQSCHEPDYAPTAMPYFLTGIYSPSMFLAKDIEKINDKSDIVPELQRFIFNSEACSQIESRTNGRVKCVKGDSHVINTTSNSRNLKRNQQEEGADYSTALGAIIPVVILGLIVALGILLAIFAFFKNRRQSFYNTI